MIEVKDLCKSYGNKSAVKNISFSIGKGEVVGLLGLNGAGKSTIMNILSGCISKTSGDVFIDGINISAKPEEAKKKIGYLPEIPPLYQDMRVCEYLNFVCELKGVKGTPNTFLDISQKTGIHDVQKRLIKNLSKGYRQRVGLAAALLGDPDILVLDEPTVGLDPTQIIEIRNLIASLKQNKTVILSSHILSEIQAVCKRVIVLNEGNIIADDTPDKLITALNQKSCLTAEIEGETSKIIELFLSADIFVNIEAIEQTEENVYLYKITGEDGSDIRREVYFLLAKNNIPLLSLKTSSMTLEDVFLNLIGKEEVL